MTRQRGVRAWRTTVAPKAHGTRSVQEQSVLVLRGLHGILLLSAAVLAWRTSFYVQMDHIFVARHVVRQRGVQRGAPT